MKLAKYTYLVAGVFGLILVVPAAYAAMVDSSEAMPDPIGAGLFLYGYISQFVAWQLLYFILAADPIRLRPMMVPAFLAELTAPLNSAWLYFYGVPPWFVLTIVFLAFATLFLVSYHRTRPRPELSAA